MEWIREYVMQVTAASLICGLICMMIGKKGAVAGTVRMLAAIFMLLTLLSPVGKVPFPNLRDLAADIGFDADQLVASGTEYRQEELVSLIKARTEAYILDKATVYGAELSVDVSLSAESLPVPKAVTIKGSISPYGKTKLSRILQDELGIPTEAQIWIGNQS